MSEFLAGLDASQLDRRSILVRGYWTDRRVPLRCAAPLSPPGALELYCGGDMSGITERNEAIGTLGPGRRWLAATGPAIVPYVPQELRERLFGLPTIHGQPYTPVPIVVRGHVNDPRAVDCRPEAHQMCLERLVIEEIVEFDPNAVPTPGITPSPSPFPFEDPPPAPFTKESCSGDVPYSFIGWGRLRDFGVESGAPNDVVYMMVTAGKVDLSDTGNGPMGRRVCFAYEWDTDGVTFAQLPD